MSIVYKSDMDGVDHINLYSRGQTELGKKASNFSRTPFVHPEYGSFASLEGAYYWVSTGMIHDDLRSLSGLQAKQYGRMKPVVKMPKLKFEKIMASFCWAKYSYHVELFDRLFRTTLGPKGVKLPFVHYYTFGQSQEIVRVPEGNEWLIHTWESIRTYSLNKLEPGVPSPGDNGP